MGTIIWITTWKMAFLERLSGIIDAAIPESAVLSKEPQEYIHGGHNNLEKCTWKGL